MDSPDPKGVEEETREVTARTRAATAENRRNILLAEFTALRGEISALLALQGQILNFGVVIFGAILTVLTRTTESDAYLPFFPIPFAILGLLYIDVSARIMRAARYIYVHIRPGLTALGGENTFQWESYIRAKHPGKALMTSLNHLRWIYFLVPGLIFTWMIRRELRALNPVAIFDVAILALYVIIALWVTFSLSRTVTES